MGNANIKFWRALHSIIPNVSYPMRFSWGMTFANWKLFPKPYHDNLEYSRHWLKKKVLKKFVLDEQYLKFNLNNLEFFIGKIGVAQKSEMKVSVISSYLSDLRNRNASLSLPPVKRLKVSFSDICPLFSN